MTALKDLSLYAVKAILILDNEGKRIIVKVWKYTFFTHRQYYDNTFPSLKAQLDFEKKLFSKTSKSAYAEITLFDGTTCVHRTTSDIYFYIIGDVNENELMLMNVLTCLHDSITQILRGNLEKKTLLDNLELIYLAVDELCDEGIIMEYDSAVLASRVGIKPEETSLSEQTVTQAMQAAREQIKMALLR
ncbi:coatomer protein complex subunit zeta 1 [Echinococcus multilocularis]|uniref:Coatomer subunit zeta n=1 Tax=Echinococcus multilocularis TaxID=6211 RepID=A0A087VZI2_ECHMU|nr:coatomer protein complex subunit zeta 1 [Echinococcus multilocularis]